MKRNNYAKPRIGLYSTGLEAYWTQFEGLHERLLTYNAFIAHPSTFPGTSDPFKFTT
ncbi:hypothetical protein [Lysinibacillus contaminans]|uniref:hypothetical protein n=1 Tax=Lysinibacillus contaminans TaxID=1293441 RepID=UPI0012E1F0DD|nr:hypothetical protein [Lysinibacillus contaminans]